jgi:hypothetical protein
MTRLWTEGETITVRLSERGWPVEFTWQGRLHGVQIIRQRWQVDTDWWTDEGRVWREYLALTTTDGLLCVVYFDLLNQSWHLSSVYD